MKAIQTRYNGCKFRSRLEARWGVFFDALGIKWDYEPEGFELSDGTRYLPDFHLPTFGGGMWVEVKPDANDFEKAKQFAREMGTRIWLADGTPSMRVWHVYEENPWTPGEFMVFTGIPNADQAEGENRMFSCPEFENEDLSIPAEYFHVLGRTFPKAVEAARSARFEFGEKG